MNNYCLIKLFEAGDGWRANRGIQNKKWNALKKARSDVARTLIPYIFIRCKLYDREE